MPKRAGVVVIGRNEGLRLERCLKSIIPEDVKTVYVDSGSTDGSVDTARRHGAAVVELDTSIPFCAARARNAGYQQLLATDPHLEYIQFIDGDCEIVAGWIESAAGFLQDHPDHAAVAGWLHEKFPEASIYNRLGDIEWNFSGAGEIDATGGIFMIRRKAFDCVGGFDPTVAAGEEPELCQRLRREGWKIRRLDRDMASHDLAMTRFGQWWQRMVRSGYSSMDVARRFRIARYKQNNRRVWFWAAWLVLLVLAGGLTVTLPAPEIALMAALLLFALWPARFIRIALRIHRRGYALRTAAAYAGLMTIVFLPQIAGQLLYLADRLRKRSFRLVEYKRASNSGIKNRHY